MDTTGDPHDPSSGRTEVLLERARGGSQEAWNVLDLRYRKMLVAHVQARIPGFARRRFDAEDVLQAALTRAWQKLDTFTYTGEGSFRRWLVRLVVNTFLNELDAQDSAARILPEEAMQAHELAQASAQLELDETRSAMLEAMGRLSEEDCDILIQKHVEDLSFEAIAQVLDCTRERAREQYQVAVERLQRHLRP